MKLRILVIDDEEQFLESVSSKLTNGLTDNPWQVPVEVYKLHSEQYDEEERLKDQLDVLAQQRWDALLVDVNLYGNKRRDLPQLMVPIELVDTFRTKNQSAIALVFSHSCPR